MGKAAIGKTNNWYTPALYIDAVREVLGTIDLDVASHARLPIRWCEQYASTR